MLSQDSQRLQWSENVKSCTIGIDTVKCILKPRWYHYTLKMFTFQSAFEYLDIQDIIYDPEQAFKIITL